MNRWTTTLAIDFDRWVAATYAANFPGVEVRCASVADEIGNLPDADVIIGGPPCQPFSNAGKGEGEDDARDCVPDFCAAVEKVRPRMFLMENVPGMLREKFLPYVREVFQRMTLAGYAVEIESLDAVCYGVPQFRERVFFWGIRRDVFDAGVSHAWPKPTHQWPWPVDGLFGDAFHLLPAVTVGQALGLAGYIQQPRAESQIRRDHPTTEPAPTIMGPHGGDRTLRYRWSDAMLAKHPPAEPAEPAPTIQAKWFKGGAEGLVRVIGGGVNPHYAGEERTERDITDEPCTTIPAQHTHNSVPALHLTIDTKQERTERPISDPAPALGVDSRHDLKDRGILVRRLTPLECARLQSCPDSMQWPEKIPKTAMYRVVGNGWACGMGAHLSRALAAADPDSRSCIDLFCGGGLGALGWHGRVWTYTPTADRRASA